MIDEKKLVGLWEHPEMTIDLQSHRAQIFWKKNGTSATGWWYLRNDVIQINYELNNVSKLFFSEIEWQAKIQNFKNNVLVLEDLTNEVGKIDKFVRQSYFDKFMERNGKHLLLASFLFFLGFTLLKGLAYTLNMSPDWILLIFSFAFFFWASRKYSWI